MSKFDKYLGKWKVHCINPRRGVDRGDFIRDWVKEDGEFELIKTMVFESEKNKYLTAYKIIVYSRFCRKRYKPFVLKGTQWCCEVDGHIVCLSISSHGTIEFVVQTKSPQVFQDGSWDGERPPN